MPTTSSSALPNTVIESIGVYLPPLVVSSSEVLNLCRTHIIFPLERLTGIKFRRMAGDVEFSIDLAIKAIEKCLANSQYGPEDIDLLICCNISRHDGPNFQFSYEPSTSVKLKKHFGFTNALSFDISNACAGMFTGITVADAFLKAGMVQRALVVSGEYITHLTRTAVKEIEDNKDSRIPCLTLGDSGAALLLERATTPQVGFHEIEMVTLGQYSDYCVGKTTDQPHGGAIMFTDSVKIHAVAIKSSVLQVVHLLKKLRWPPNDQLNHIIMHQTARTAIAETAAQINMLLNREFATREMMINNLAERGNTSTTTHTLAVWDNILNNTIQDGERILFTVQASGITIGAAPYTFDSLPSRIRRQELGHVPARKQAASRTRRHDVARPRVRVESVGLTPDAVATDNAAVVRRNSLELARLAGEDCLQRSAHPRSEIDLIMHAGVYRDEFLSEPAIAALLAGSLNVNAAMDPTSAAPRTFAFDVFNGSVGFLNACYNAVAMIESEKYKNVLVITSEIENNVGVKPDSLLGLRETGSAVILDRPEGGNVGFGRFLFRYFTDYLNDITTYIAQDQGRSWLHINRDPKIEGHYLDCVGRAVKDLLDQEGLQMSDLRAIIPPQVSPGFVQKLTTSLGVARERVVDLAADGKDFFTSSLPYGLRSAQERAMVKPGDVGLIINVGTGIQVGCALYHF